MKEEFTKDIEILRKINKTQILEIKMSLRQIKNNIEHQYGRQEQLEDRISGLKNKICVKEQNRRILN
jgi:hypothetical protein